MYKTISKLTIDGVSFEIKDALARQQLAEVGAVDYDMETVYTSATETLNLDIVKKIGG